MARMFHHILNDALEIKALYREWLRTDESADKDAYERAKEIYCDACARLLPEIFGLLEPLCDGAFLYAHLRDAVGRWLIFPIDTFVMGRGDHIGLGGVRIIGNSENLLDLRFVPGYTENRQTRFDLAHEELRRLNSPRNEQARDKLREMQTEALNSNNLELAGRLSEVMGLLDIYVDD
jgi:hypothetical protein